MEGVKALLIFFVVGMFVFSLAPVLAEENISAGDASSAVAEDITSVETIPAETIPADAISTEDAGANVPEDVVNLEVLGKEYAGETIVDPGLTPDSAFYFVDGIMSNFKDSIQNREEKVAEIKAMVEEGNYDAAKIALEKYKGYADKVESEADPAKREEARKSAAVIYRTMTELDSKIVESEKGNFVNGVLEKETGIITAVEISDKIKSLCEQLAGLDPLQYSKICNVEGDAPKWKKNLNQQLTKEQEVEAKKFGEIMSSCFKTSGRDCKCEDISFYDFSVACDKIAPLAVACDEGDESSCQAMEEVKMPTLPDYLQNVFDTLQMDFGEAKYGMYMPPECVKEGAKDPKDCMLVMTQINAPYECKAILKEGIESGKIKGEKDARQVCDEIMMPPECKGLTPDECGKKMMPPECVEKNLELSECKKFMDSMMEGPGNFGSPGADCMGIQDSNERLKCFENSVNGIGEQYGVGEKFQDVQGEITWQCKENRIHWPPDCEKFMREEFPKIQQREMDDKQRMIEDENRWVDEQKSQDTWKGYDCSKMDCPNGYHCEPDYGCMNDGGQDQVPKVGEQPPGCEGLAPNCGPNSYPSCQDGRNWVCSTPEPAPTVEPTPTPTEPAPIISEPIPEPEPEPAPVTGGVFWDYYSRR